MDASFRMHAERTPNPNSIKWVLGRPIVPGAGSAEFDEAPAEETCPLAAELFRIEGVRRVFLASNFVTVTKRDDLDWADLAQPIVAALKRHLGSGEPALGPGFQPAPAAPESEVAERIRRLLDEKVRPAVAMDGGDIVFAGFRNGIVELYMHGSCSGCPSSTATLKQGVEALLRAAVPEVRGVVAL